MSITLTEIVEDAAQVDGRRHITERHLDHLGVAHFVRWLANADADALAIAQARAATLADRFAQQEMERNIAFILEGNYAAVTTNHISVTDARVALRALYQTATGEQVGRMAGYLLTLTDAQLRTLFNLTQQQVNQLRTRMQTRVDALNAVLTATGE